MMKFTFTDEQEALRDSIHGLLAARSPLDVVRETAASEVGYDPSLWKEMATEMGLSGFTVPEEFGGGGFCNFDLTVVLEEMGAVVLNSPFFATVCLAIPAIMEAGSNDDRNRWLPDLAAGVRTATLAVFEPDRSWDPIPTVVAEGSGGKFDVTGHKAYVLDGSSADLLVVSALMAGDDPEPSLFVIERSAPGVLTTLLDTLDPTRRLAHVEFNHAPAYPLRGDADLVAVIQRVLDRAGAYLAMELVGTAQAALDQAVAYAKQRHQFGRPIGSFQAIKHKCADMLLEVESARSAAMYAMWAMDENTDEFHLAAPMAHAYAMEAAYHCSAENIQVHGGIGFTWEHHAHVFFRRASSGRALFGPPELRREHLARRLGLGVRSTELDDG